MCKINTANYKNCQTENGISISWDGGLKARFKGRFFSQLAPSQALYQEWHDNIGKIPEEDNTRFYATRYYNEILSKLDPQEVYDMIPEESILLCDEEPEEVSNRQLFAFWIELFLGVQTSEVYENPVRETLRKLDRPEYLKDVLEEVIKENYDMHGFDTIEEAYRYNKVHKKDTVNKKNKKLILAM